MTMELLASGMHAPPWPDSSRTTSSGWWTTAYLEPVKRQTQTVRCFLTWYKEKHLNLYGFWHDIWKNIWIYIVFDMIYRKTYEFIWLFVFLWFFIWFFVFLIFCIWFFIFFMCFYIIFIFSKYFTNFVLLRDGGDCGIHNLTVF